MSPHIFRRHTQLTPLPTDAIPSVSASSVASGPADHYNGASFSSPATPTFQTSPDKRRRETAVISTSPYRSSEAPRVSRAPPTLGSYALGPIAASPEMEWKPGSSNVASGSRSGRRGSPPSPSQHEQTSPHSSPRSASSARLHGEPLRRVHSPRTKNGTAGAKMASPESSERRRRTQSERDDRGGKTSPLTKRYVDDSGTPQTNRDRANTTSQMYPGLVLGSFGGDGNGTTSTLDFSVNGMNFGGSMDDILDPSAPYPGSGRNGSIPGQAGANIAPWLNDDSAPHSEPTTISGSATPVERNPSMQALNHQTSNPAFPHPKKQGTGFDFMEAPNGSYSRNGSQPSIFPSGSSASTSSAKGVNRSRKGSDESIQTLGGMYKGKKGSSPVDEVGVLPAPMARQPSMAGARMARLGSTASNMSGAGSMGSEKKRGFLGGFLKRKTGQSVSSNYMPDFGPTDFGHRGSASGSANSRVSSSNSTNSLSQKRSVQSLNGGQGDPDASGRRFERNQSFMSEDAISPLSEIGENEFHLDMNLDDMEGIVDTNLANTQPTVIPPRPTGMSIQTNNTSPTTTAQSTSSSMLLQDALDQTSSFATTVSAGSTGSTGSDSPSAGATPGRSVLSEAHRTSGNPFSRNNPFQPGSSDGSIQSMKPATPPSPYTRSLSPKHSMPPSTQPRRPSQLRNVKMGSADSDASSDAPDSGPLQPLAPAWATMTPASQTVFNDPFGSTSTFQPATGEGVSPSRPPTRSARTTPQATSESSFPLSLQVPVSAVPPSSAAAAAVWAAPESWGVEGDEDDEDEEMSTSDEEAQAWADEFVDDDAVSPTGEGGQSSTMVPKNSLSVPRKSIDAGSAIGAAGKPPPFGFKSTPPGAGGKRPSGNRPPAAGQTRVRGKGSNARPSTGVRPSASGRPGTSGSMNVGIPYHWIRIYRADGSYNIMSFPLATTTAEIINVLSGANDTAPGKKVTTNMKLYLRERGQDRQLLPSEKPLAIQERRLRQSGYTDAEKVEELGKQDLFILCKFIYQTPVLPVMDPEEESSYDSFEFIDISGRDLQTVPIFLHMHADNISFLNVSRNPMTDLPLDFIQACTSLNELRMCNMALKRVPASIRASTTLTRLDISSNRIADLESVPLNEIASLMSIKVQNNKLSTIPTYFAQMKSLKYLNISNNKFDTFPAVVCEMSNLVDLDVSFNEIAALPAEMSNLKSLERLAAYGNELTTFPESFSTLANLRSLDVRRNKLTDLTSVYALPNLAELQADHNNLVTLDAQIGAKVREFSVPHNSITRFTLASLSNMAVVNYSLTHLNLSYGKISTLADEALSGLVNLIELNLNFNQFTRLPPTIGNLINLETLSCTDNMLEELPPGLSKMKRLKVLNVHNNNLKALPSDMWMCMSMVTFNCSSNLLTGVAELPSEMIAQLIADAEKERQRLRDLTTTQEELDDLNSSPLLPVSSLQYVYLADNRFNEDIFHSIAQLTNLKVANLSFNDIFEIPPGTLSKVLDLEELYLSGNKLTSLPSEDLEKLQKLRVLHLNGNKLQTLPSELGAIKTLRHLDVGSNVLKYNIANWPYDWNWNWNTSLRYLNLSGNKRLEIKPTSASDMSHASAFRKELSDFSALSKLRLLGLMDVAIRIPTLPDESEDKRVRTSFADINNMAYGISDLVGPNERLSMFDIVVPNFRGQDNECLFGMFGRANPASGKASGRIPKFLQENYGSILASQLDNLVEGEAVLDAMRRAFLASNRRTFEYLLQHTSKGRKGSIASLSDEDPMLRNWQPSPQSHFRTGASGAVVYLVGRTMYVANAGICLVVMSRKGEAELLSKLHDPTDREETARLRRAEAWVSPKGFVNDDKDVDISRAIGYFQTFPATNASPELRKRELEEQDEFVIIGNHALWACCSYQTAVDIARTERADPMMAAQKLRDFALSYGAEGAVMVMVVNVSDLFRAKGRTRGVPGSGPVQGEAISRNIRRRYEEVGDRTLNRLQQEIEPPQGQVAIVFTDIVNSTHLWETNPGMPTAIKIHHSFMRRQLRLDGGYEVKTEGDSFMVSFQTVPAALLWAFNCQIGLLQQEWPRELLEAPDGKIVHDSEGVLVQRGLRVRMGVHWGAPNCERDPITRRMDYYGPMVNRAARINASADGGQLMASQDVILEVEALREYLETLDADGLKDMPGEMKREAMELRRIGFEVKEMGERKLKGLEVPEKLHLLYPKSLAGRFETSNDLRANAERADAAQALASQTRVIDIEEVRELSRITLRLEALCSISSISSIPSAASSPAIAASASFVDPLTTAVEMTPSKRAYSIRAPKGPPPAYLGPSIRDEMMDEELSVIIESLTTRIENSMSTLYLKHLGGFSSVLAALQQATQIDSNLLVHAMSLMSGAMKK